MIQENFKTILTGEQIKNRLREIAVEIVFEKIPADAREVLLVPIMTGAQCACRQIRHFMEGEFGKRDSRSKAPVISEKPLYVKRSEGTELVEPSLINFQYTKEDFAEKTVIIVDDLVDEGLTLQLAYKTIRRFRPLKLITVVVIKKTDFHTDGWLNYAAFELRYPLEKARKRWLFGYGMDINGEGRDLDFIGEVAL